MIGRARARANIALAKYWGKSDETWNLPAVSSLSITLDPLITETEVTFDGELAEDAVFIDGRPATGRARTRVIDMLDRFRARADVSERACVVSSNFFPTAAGLASSASGFAALAQAASQALSLNLSAEELSREARHSSASAARSIFGGYVVLPAGKPGDRMLSAAQHMPAEAWDLRVIVAVTAQGPKKIGSTEAMRSTEKTSPYYKQWLTTAEQLFLQIRQAVSDRNLRVLGPLVQHSTFAMHACALAADPSIFYWQPATLRVLRSLQTWQEQGLQAFSTMDAGPHVKIICKPENAATIVSELSQIEGVIKIIMGQPGGGVEPVVGKFS